MINENYYIKVKNNKISDKNHKKNHSVYIDTGLFCTTIKIWRAAEKAFRAGMKLRKV